MEQTQYNSLFSFIWNIATDVLLEPTKEQILFKIGSCLADLQAEIDYLKELKQRLISDAVTGQICVAEPQKGDKQ